MSKYQMLIKIGKVLIVLAVVLLIIGFAVAIIFGFPIKHTLRVIFGSIYVLFVPGFIWSYVFFPKREKRSDIRKDVIAPPAKAKENGIPAKAGVEKPLDAIERITLSIALSMAMGPLLIFFLNKIGVKINFINSFLELLVLIIVGLVIILIKEQKIINHSK